MKGGPRVWKRRTSSQVVAGSRILRTENGGWGKTGAERGKSRFPALRERKEINEKGTSLRLT